MSRLQRPVRRSAARVLPPPLFTLLVALVLAGRGTPAAADILWVEGSSIVHATDSGSIVATLSPGVGAVNGVAVDPINARLFFTTASTLYSAGLDGTNVQTVRSGFWDAFYMSYDAAHARLYGTEYFGSTHAAGDGIWRINTDGTNFEMVAATTSGTTGVAVDPANDRLFYEDNNGLHSAHLDGSGQTLLAGPLNNLTGITVDASGDIYWAEQNGLRIGTSAGDGTGANFDLITTSNGIAGPTYGPNGIGTDGTYLYWSERDAKAIKKANLDGTGVTTLVSGRPTNPVGLIYFELEPARTPEPGALALLGVGLAGYRARRRRRREAPRCCRKPAPRLATLLS